MTTTYIAGLTDDHIDQFGIRATQDLNLARKLTVSSAPENKTRITNVSGKFNESRVSNLSNVSQNDSVFQTYTSIGAKKTE